MKSRPIHPVSHPVTGTFRPPGSRSLTNRALMVAALADGTSILDSVGLSGDTRICAEVLCTLGLRVTANKAAARLTIAGGAGRVPPGPKNFNTGDSGTVARFLTALVAAGRGRYRIDGSPRMRRRPIQDLLDGLAALGVRAESQRDTGCPPVIVTTTGLRGGTVRVRGDVSSQYLSGLLMAAPAATAPLTIEVDGDLVSKPYVDMTLSVMRDFGVEVARRGYAFFTVPAPAAYHARRYMIEPDASSASYFLAAAAATGGRVTIENLARTSIQGDARFADVLARMGCKVCWDKGGVTVAGPKRLKGITIDLNSMPDMVTTLAPLALLARGKTTIENVANLRVKESDRLSALATELKRLGATVDERPDGLTIHPPREIRPATVATYHDHRLAMGLAIVGLVVPGLRIANPACVAKTYPRFFEDLERLCGT